MDTIPFQTALDNAADKCGLLNADGTLLTVHAAFLIRCMQQRMRKAWRYYQWPDLCPVELRAFRPVFSLAGTYTLDAEVYALPDPAEPNAGRYYRCIKETTGHDVSDVAFWEPVKDLEKTVSFDQTGENRIGELLGAWRKDPAKSRYADPLAYSLTRKGALFKYDAPNTVWIKYRQPVPEFTSAIWTAGTYDTGTLRYFAHECYRAAVYTAAQPGGQDETWELQPLPNFLHDYLAQAVYADFLKDEGQTDKAAFEANQAETILDDEIAQITTQQNQTQRYRVRTRNALHHHYRARL